MAEDKSSPPTPEEENLDHIFEELKEEKAVPPVPAEDEMGVLLEETLSEGLGRIVSLRRTSTGWIASVERWEEMRLRNVQHPSWRTPKMARNDVSLTRVSIDLADGKFTFKISGV